MKYRRFGNTDYQASVLGFGCMRLPTVRSTDEVDADEAVRMIRYAVDRGLNYIDTAYGYHGGESEKVVGRALKDGYRDRVKLVTKLPVWHVESPADFDRLLDEQLERLQDSRLDFYLLHSLTAQSWAKVRDMDVLGWAERAMASGRFGALGFSFHDSNEAFAEIVNAWDGWALAQIQYNYLNEDYQAGTQGLELAASKGIPVVVMEPLLGGSLVEPPEAVQRVWDGAPVARSAAEWALQWLWSKPEVTLVLSGMSAMGQVEENLAAADRSEVGLLSPEDLERVAQVRDVYRQLRAIPCTRCGYCMPCPGGVDIPTNLNLYNNGYMYNKMARAAARYGRMKPETRASACTQCHACEKACPQKIDVSEWMACIDAELGARL